MTYRGDAIMQSVYAVLSIIIVARCLQLSYGNQCVKYDDNIRNIVYVMRQQYRLVWL